MIQGNEDHNKPRNIAERRDNAKWVIKGQIKFITNKWKNPHGVNISKKLCAPNYTFLLKKQSTNSDTAHK